MAMWCRIVLSLYAGRLFLATDKTQHHNGTPALYKWGQWGVADIFIAATWGRDQRRWMSKTCKTTSYGTGALLLWNIHPPNSDLCQPNRQSLQIVGDKDATLIRDAGW